MPGGRVALQLLDDLLTGKVDGLRPRSRRPPSWTQGLHRSRQTNVELSPGRRRLINHSDCAAWGFGTMG